jgi:hypothetical protein
MVIRIFRPLAFAGSDPFRLKRVVGRLADEARANLGIISARSQLRIFSLLATTFKAEDDRIPLVARIFAQNSSVDCTSASALMDYTYVPYSAKMVSPNDY